MEDEGSMCTTSKAMLLFFFVPVPRLVSQLRNLFSSLIFLDRTIEWPNLAARLLRQLRESWSRIRGKDGPIWPHES